MNAPFSPPICPPPFPPWWVQQGECCWDWTKALEKLMAKLMSDVINNNPDLLQQLIQEIENAIGTGVVGVTSWNGRVGAVTMTLADLLAAGGAPLNSPQLTGTPTSPTGAAGDNSNQIATDAFVTGAVGSFAAQLAALQSALADLQAQLGAGGGGGSTGGTGNRVPVGSVQIVSSTATADIFADFTQYPLYELEYWDVLPQGTDMLMLQTSTDGSTFNSNPVYDWTFQAIGEENQSTLGSYLGAYPATGIGLNWGEGVDTPDGASGVVRVAVPGLAGRLKCFQSDGVAIWAAAGGPGGPAGPSAARRTPRAGTGTAAWRFVGSGLNGNDTAPLRGVRFLFWQYPIMRGNFAVYGLAA